ncbi:hypothetical protein GSI_06720 [Ganoderma sinense ZZ0214-1]|uniref:Elongator complex protein 5 n=1 Tax=Ganoderma sinense ZZ0214-1 TaxID=1077348 RepID=A0A2G8SE17_9APHY|nr:hypothetical protein GSI_06720 [Ganoderma sinense ZZ0214-1]
MPSLLSSTLAHTSRNQHLLLLQSSAAQTCLPVLRAIVKQAIQRARETTILFCFLYRPSSFSPSRLPSDRILVVDKTASVPGYDDASHSEQDRVPGLKKELLETIRSAPPGPLSVVIDSVDTLCSDIGSLSETARLLSEALALVREREGSSRLVLHALALSPLFPLLNQTRFSPSLTHLTAHPSALLMHLASAYLTPPPPLSPDEKFWGVFIPISERHYESEKLVFGPGGEGSGSPAEFVVEVLVRGGVDNAGRRRGTQRVLEGWSAALGSPCELHQLESLKALWSKKNVIEVQSAPDPTQDLSFNLNLTLEQQRSRSQVPLPYAHEGKPQAAGAILYDPDSADDLDDDDPDDDLDI